MILFNVILDIRERMMALRITCFNCGKSSCDTNELNPDALLKLPNCLDFVSLRKVTFLTSSRKENQNTIFDKLPDAIYYYSIGMK
jgi:hypothetical protein